MIDITKIMKPNKLNKEIDSLLDELQYHEKDSKEYAQILNQLEKLEKMKAMRKEHWIKPDQMVGAGANLAGILLILKHEELNVIVSKALSFVVKGRV